MKGIKNENDGKKSLHGIRRNGIWRNGIQQNGIRQNGKTPTELLPRYLIKCLSDLYETYCRLLGLRRHPRRVWYGVVVIVGSLGLGRHCAGY